MAVMEGDDRVEIELTPNDPRRGHRTPRAGGGSTPPAEPTPTPTDGVGAWASSPSRRTAVVAVAVGVVTLSVGWALGRATSGGDGATATTASTSGTSTLTTEPAEPTLPPVERTTRPVATTTTLAPLETVAAEVDPALAGMPYEVVGLDRTGALNELDLSTGDLTVRRDLGAATGGGPTTMWAGAGWVLLPVWDTGGTMLVADGEEPVVTDLGPPWQLIESATSGQFWLVDEGVGNSADGSARLVNRRGEPTRTRIALDEYPLFADPLGGLVITAAGSTYRVDTDGATKISDGLVIALDAERAFARSCDDDLVCKYVVVDRATGEVRDTPLDPSVRYLTNAWPATDAMKIAPDGRTVAARWIDPADDMQVLGLLDLESGEITVLSRASDGSLRWSPDGRFAFYLDAGLPMAYELSTGVARIVSDDLPRLDGLVVRPVSP